MAHELLVLYQRAFDLYLSLLPEHFAAAVRPFPYDPVETARKAPWSKQLAGMMIAGDIQETLNAIHQWGDQVLSLRAWCAVAASDAFDEQDHWTVRAAFIEPVATWCLLQPAATRDRLGNVATNLVHQGRLTLDAGYKDVLVQDNLSGRGQMNRFLNRPAREAQLSRLDDRFSAFPAFIDSLEALDDAPFREATFHANGSPPRWAGP
jgi:hypothetical protein